MTLPEDINHGLITTGTGGLIRRMDQRLELVSCLIDEIQAKQTSLNKANTTLEIPLGAGVVMLMKWCHSGSFLMGSPEDEEERSDDENQVRVTLSKGFWIGQRQVTQAQWQAVMGNNPSHFIGENLPVETVSWNDAQEFISKINASCAISDGLKMTLPTEAQWEYASRAGEAGPYPGGILDEVAWYDHNSGDRTHPVGTKEPNAWGLQDMLGNVWEWCEDWHDDELPGGVDPKGAVSGSFRVIRGGSWNYEASICRVANRFVSVVRSALRRHLLRRIHRCHSLQIYDTYE